MNEINVSVIIPAYNEKDYIEKTISAILLWSVSLEIIVVDDGSTDNTGTIVSDLKSVNKNINLITLEKNSGKGNALMNGIKYAEGSILIFLDADLGNSAQYAINLIYPIKDDEADMTIAILPSTNKKAGFGMVKTLAREGIYYFTGYSPIAPLSGQRAIRKDKIDKINRFSPGFGIEVGLTIDALRNGLRILEIELPLKHRDSKRDIAGFLHRGKEFLDVLRALYYSWRQTLL